MSASSTALHVLVVYEVRGKLKVVMHNVKRVLLLSPAVGLSIIIQGLL